MKSWVRGEHPECFCEAQKAAEFIFPELKESEDERIRKAIIAYISHDQHCGVSNADMIAWLEKQGIQTTDKVEPKFEVGDWIVLPLVIIAHIESLNSTDYQVTTTDGKICDFKISKQDNYRLWSITDAKNGDLIYVSTEEKGIQAIFHEYKNDTIFFHCYLCADFVQGGYMPIGSVELTYPLQKTHYNRFFEKMHEAGYEWDGKKKELKKIETHYDVKNFHAGMPVLVRIYDNHKWCYLLFSHCYKHQGILHFSCGGAGWLQCIPFEGNEHLLGTTDMCDEKFINW